MVARLFGSACTDERTTNETETLVFYVRQHLWMDHEPRSSLFVARSVLFVSCKARLFFSPRFERYDRFNEFKLFCGSLFSSRPIYTYIRIRTYVRIYIYIHIYINVACHNHLDEVYRETIRYPDERYPCAQIFY